MPQQKKPIKPVDFGELEDPIYNRFGAYRNHGPHNGIDIYKDRHTEVKAVLGGRVIRANGKKGHSTYGGLVIIDHTPERKLGPVSLLPFNLYTLYAHLEKTDVKLDQRIHKGDKIGTVGNSGNAIKMPPHLHFEVIRSSKALGWKTSGSTGVHGDQHRIDPLPFLRGHTLLGPGYEEGDPLEKEELKAKILQRMDVDPHFDLRGGTWWLDVKLGGKNVGRIDRHRTEIKLSLSPGEVEEILAQPPVLSRKKELVCEIKI